MAIQGYLSDPSLTNELTEFDTVEAALEFLEQAYLDGVCGQFAAFAEGDEQEIFEVHQLRWSETERENVLDIVLDASADYLADGAQLAEASLASLKRRWDEVLDGLPHEAARELAAMGREGLERCGTEFAGVMQGHSVASNEDTFLVAGGLGSGYLGEVLLEAADKFTYYHVSTCPACNVVTLEMS